MQLLRLSAPLLILGLFLVGACGKTQAHDALAELVFTAIPDDDPTLLKERFDPVAEYLSEKLGVPVRYFPTTSYQASVEAFKNGDVLLAWFGGLTGVQARAAIPGSHAIAQGAIDPNFRSYFIAGTGTGISPSETFPMELEGRSFTFGSVASTSGRLMPEHYIRTATGRSPEDFFGKANHYSGSHDKTAELVASGVFAAGALNYLTYDRLIAEGSLDPAEVQVVWTTPEYADYNWTAHPDLNSRFGSDMLANLQKALIEMNDGTLLKAIDRPEGLIPASNADFAAIEELARQLNFLR